VSQGIGKDALLDEHGSVVRHLRDAPLARAQHLEAAAAHQLASPVEGRQKDAPPFLRQRYFARGCRYNSGIDNIEFPADGDHISQNTEASAIPGLSRLCPCSRIPRERDDEAL
jgi:hypothetical protein